jgi:hypothetical protein
MTDAVFHRSARTIRTVLIQSFSELREAAEDAARDGARAAGDTLLILAYRVAQALLVLSHGARYAWDKFWGIPPAVFSVAASLFILLLAGAIVVSLNPGLAQGFGATAKVASKLALKAL